MCLREGKKHIYYYSLVQFSFNPSVTILVGSGLQKISLGPEFREKKSALLLFGCV
jgi:hypothetical protein